MKVVIYISYLCHKFMSMCMSNWFLLFISCFCFYSFLVFAGPSKTSYGVLPQSFFISLVLTVITMHHFLLSSSHSIFQALNGKLLKTRDKNARRDIQKELRTLSKEERKKQQLAVTDVIKNADVVLTTLTGAVSQKLENTSFDLVIIDEAAQALEIACWIALLKVIVLCKSKYILEMKTCIRCWLFHKK